MILIKVPDARREVLHILTSQMLERRPDTGQAIGGIRHLMAHYQHTYELSKAQATAMFQPLLEIEQHVLKGLGALRRSWSGTLRPRATANGVLAPSWPTPTGSLWAWRRPAPLCCCSLATIRTASSASFPWSSSTGAANAGSEQRSSLAAGGAVQRLEPPPGPRRGDPHPGRSALCPGAPRRPGPDRQLVRGACPQARRGDAQYRPSAHGRPPGFHPSPALFPATPSASAVSTLPPKPAPPQPHHLLWRSL